MQQVITPSDKPTKKFEARIDGKKSIHFGAKSYEDFTIHKESERKRRYIDRHSKNEDWTNPLTAGFYSRWIAVFRHFPSIYLSEREVGLLNQDTDDEN